MVLAINKISGRGCSNKHIIMPAKEDKSDTTCIVLLFHHKKHLRVKQKH